MSSNLSDVITFYRYELRAALRERSIVINTLLIPIFMYPFLLWAMFTGIMYVAGQVEGLTSRVAVIGEVEGRSALEELVAKDDKQKLQPPLPKTKALEQIRSGDLDVLLELSPVAPAPDSPLGNFSARIYFDRSKDRSQQARDRLEETLNRYRSQWLETEASRLGVTGGEWQGFLVERQNVATDRQMGRFILSTMLPLFLVIMIAVGCFYPAVDSTAGERERSTWETSMSTAASRGSILTAKYLYVATLGSVAGLINVAAMLVSAKAVLAPLTQEMGEKFDFRIPFEALPVLVVGTVLLALFVAAVMMLLASFARTFREGQSMISPFYMAIILPVVFVRTDSEFTAGQALIPIVNVTKLFAQVINGQIPLVNTVLTLFSELICIFIVLRLAAAVIRFEDFMIGSYRGSFAKFVRERFLGNRKSPTGEVR
ncbi:MAG TPA: ABC transporter permease subunit [Acidobacteriota bacterium]|nr:ABC transporter permease subunit [Acidobacteriota bacterium]